MSITTVRILGGPSLSFPIQPNTHSTLLNPSLLSDQAEANEEWVNVTTSQWRFEATTFRNYTNVVDVVNRLFLFTQSNQEKNCLELGENIHAFDRWKDFTHIMGNSNPDSEIVGRFSQYVCLQLQIPTLPPMPAPPQPKMSLATRFSYWKEEVKQKFAGNNT